MLYVGSKIIEPNKEIVLNNLKPSVILNKFVGKIINVFLNRIIKRLFKKGK